MDTFLTLLEDAEEWNTEKGLTYAVFLPTNREKSIVRKNGTNINIRALQGHNHGVAIDLALFSWMKIPLNWKEHIFHTGSLPPTNPSWWSTGRRFESKKHKTILFFLALNPQESSSQQPDDEPRMALKKHSYRPDQDCIYYFNLRNPKRKSGIPSKHQ